MRTGNPTYRAVAKRWSKVMLILFAVGVVTGTILSFELGLLWPQFMAKFGDVFGLAFALEGISFFCEAIFIAIYVYGWDRIEPRKHFLSGIPIVISGFTGSLFVLSVNGWMNHPTGFSIVNGEVTDVAPARGALQRQPLARARPHVPGRIHRLRLRGRRRLRVLLDARQALRVHPRRSDRAAHGRLPGDARAAARRRLGRAHGRREPAAQAGRVRGSHARPKRERRSTSAASTSMVRTISGSRSPTCSRYSPSTTPMRRSRASTRCRPPTARLSPSSATRST